MSEQYLIETITAHDYPDYISQQFVWRDVITPDALERRLAAWKDKTNVVAILVYLWESDESLVRGNYAQRRIAVMDGRAIETCVAAWYRHAPVYASGGDRMQPHVDPQWHAVDLIDLADKSHLRQMVLASH